MDPLSQYPAVSWPNFKSFSFYHLHLYNTATQYADYAFANSLINEIEYDGDVVAYQICGELLQLGLWPFAFIECQYYAEGVLLEAGVNLGYFPNVAKLRKLNLIEVLDHWPQIKYRKKNCQKVVVPYCNQAFRNKQAP